MKKIGILAFGDKHGGGVYQYTQSIVNALKDDKTNHYTIFCNREENRFDSCGLEVRKVNKPKSSLLIKILRTLQFIFFIRKPWFFTINELDIFSDIDLFLSPFISAYPHFYLNKPFVFTLHDMQEKYYPEFFSQYERSLRWLNNRTLAKSSNKIICESNFVKSDIVRFIGIKEHKIRIIQSPPTENFLNHNFKENQFKIIREKYNLPYKYIFYPAQCWFHKNHIALVESFEIVSKQIDDVHLILTGSQQNNYDHLMTRINELNLNHRVKHLGYIEYKDLPYLYKMSQFLIMPTLFESISIPIYEAFALEVAVCSSNAVGLPEQIGDAGLIFNPHSIIDISEKMMMYLTNNDLRIEKAKNGFKRISEFSHESYKNKLLEVCSEYKSKDINNHCRI